MMILRIPDFYDRFRCTASKCSDTCCVGWEIDVDEATCEMYGEVDGAFGERLAANIEEGHFKLLPGDRCPFLNKDNLCEIYMNLGEEALCDICTEHPRFVEVYGDLMEKGVGLCCEEAVRLLLESESPLTFKVIKVDEPAEELSGEDRKIRDEVLYEREQMFGILADKEIPFEEKLERIFGKDCTLLHLDSAGVCQMVELLAKTESYGVSWDLALQRIQKRLEEQASVIEQGYFSEAESERLLAYMIFRYYAKCLYEGFPQGKLRFALYFWNICRLFTQELSGELLNESFEKISCKIKAIKLLSKQLEYSEENMRLVESSLEMEKSLI